VLYPYGRGCSYDCTTDIKLFAKHAALMLKRAGSKQGRRYQQSPEWIFALYTYEMKRMIGGIAYRANNPAMDDVQDQEGIAASITVEHMTEVLGCLTTTVDETTSSIEQPTPSLTSDQLQAHIRRMTPYSRALSG
jgi:hypothetical protein